MEFNNKENFCYQTTCNKKLWDSRSVAVCVCIIRTHPDDSTKIQVLGNKRGIKMTNPGKWCFPCGFLDWNETIPMAAVREVFEETGLEISWKELDFCEIDSNPEKFGQNVTVHFLLYYNKEKNPSTENASVDEVQEVRWFSMNEAKNEDWAFDHKQRLDGLINLFEVSPQEDPEDPEDPEKTEQ